MAQFVVTSYQLKRWASALEAANKLLPVISMDASLEEHNEYTNVSISLSEIRRVLNSNDETIPQET